MYKELKKINIASDKYYYPDYLPKEILSVRLWYQYLKENRQYHAYCRAIREADRDLARGIEQRYDKIHQIYIDWGDLYRNNKSTLVTFQNWYPSHSKLFYPSHGNVKLHQATELVENATVVSIPHSLEIADATKQIETLLNLQTEKDLRPRTTPKYQFYPNGDIQTAQLESLRKTFLVHCLAERSPPGSKNNRSNAVIAVALTQASSKYWPWELNELEQRLLHSEELKSSALESKKAQIKYYRRRAKILIENTLHGRFPCYAKSI